LILVVALIVEILQLIQSESGLILMIKSFQTLALDATKMALLGLTNLAWTSSKSILFFWLYCFTSSETVVKFFTVALLATGIPFLSIKVSGLSSCPSISCIAFFLTMA
jgi:hypothetical protein